MHRLSYILGAFLIAALYSLPTATQAWDLSYYLDFATRAVIFAIAAVSLDLILGYGGMVSFGHAAFLGIGGYAVGILGYHGITDGFTHFAVAIGASALVALFIGMVSVRTTGVYFIMITLAFSQMLYYLAISLNAYGGDDGLSLRGASDFSGLIDLSDHDHLYYVSLTLLLLCLLFCYRLIGARFGMVLKGIKSDERRLIAIGFSPFRFKLLAFVLSGVMCGISGALLANQTLFISPAIMHWSRSGEVMVMVILGGMSTLFGPVIGAALYLGLEETLSRFTSHWQLLLGPLLVVVVLFARNGIFGLFTRRRRKIGHG